MGKMPLLLHLGDVAAWVPSLLSSEHPVFIACSDRHQHAKLTTPLQTTVVLCVCGIKAFYVFFVALRKVRICFAHEDVLVLAWKNASWKTVDEKEY